MHILVTRPETEAPRTTRKLEAMGHRVTVAPLLEIVTQSPPLDVTGVQAIVLTSRNAVHAIAAHPQIAQLRMIPALAVGKSTAAAARDAGLTVTLEGDAGGAELAALITANLKPDTGALLHISGEAIAFDLEHALAPAGFTLRRAVVYASHPIQALSSAVAASLRAGDLDAVLLMSPRTATAWCTLVAGADLSEKARTLVHLCLSSGVADAVRILNPPHIATAVKPNEEEMLALAARLSSSSAHNR